MPEPHLLPPRYNAHTTAAEVLLGGIAVLTLPGQCMQSRVASGLLIHMAGAALLADSVRQYTHRLVSTMMDQHRVTEDSGRSYAMIAFSTSG